MGKKETAMTPYQAFRHEMEKPSVLEQFAAVLPKHIGLDKFKRVCFTAFAQSDDLEKCSQTSVLGACMQAATDGLLPDGREAAIVKFKNEAAYMPMVAGVLKKIRNSGQLKSINAEVVHEADEYDAWADEGGQHFKFRKARKDRGAAICTIAYATTLDGGFYFEEMSEEEMGDIEACARSKNIWQGPFRDQMKKKSILHRISKRLPMSSDIETLFSRDEDLYEMPGKDAPREEAPVVHDSASLAEKMKPVEAEVVEEEPVPVREPGEDDLI